MQNPSISVIVPVYNIEKHIERCLNSIISQDFEDLEIIVVNDGSTDDSYIIVQQIADRDKRVVIINKPNGGLSSARNAGVMIARGEYIAHIDGDDWIEQGYLKAMYEHAIGSDLDVVISDYWKDYDNGAIKRVLDLRMPQGSTIDNTMWLEKFFARKAGHSLVNKIFRKKLYELGNICHPEHISTGEDLVTTIKLMHYADRIAKVKQCKYHYIQRLDSITNNKSSAKIEESLRSMTEAFKVLQEFFINDYAIRMKLKKHRVAQIAMFIFTPFINQDSLLMCELTKEYLAFNSNNKINYSTNRIQIYSTILKVCPQYRLLQIIQYVNKLAFNIYCKFTGR